MFRIDKQTGNVFIHEGKNEGEHIMTKEDGSETRVPDPRDWCVGAAYLARCFGVTVQRIYQLRDIGVLTPEEVKDGIEEVYNLSIAIRDMAQYKRFGRDGLFSGGELRKVKKRDCDPLDYSDYGIEFDDD